MSTYRSQHVLKVRTCIEKRAKRGCRSVLERTLIDKITIARAIMPDDVLVCDKESPRNQWPLAVVFRHESVPQQRSACQESADYNIQRQREEVLRATSK